MCILQHTASETTSSIVCLVPSQPTQPTLRKFSVLLHLSGHHVPWRDVTLSTYPNVWSGLMTHLLAPFVGLNNAHGCVEYDHHPE
jgi:hypothetical protein